MSARQDLTSRWLQQHQDSPLFSFNLSPMSALSNQLCNQSLDTPRRRLSLNSSSNDTSPETVVDVAFRLSPPSPLDANLPRTSDYASASEPGDPLTSPACLPSPVFVDESTSDSHDSGISTESHTNRATDFKHTMQMEDTRSSRENQVSPMEDVGFFDDQQCVAASSCNLTSESQSELLCGKGTLAHKAPPRRGDALRCNTPARELRDVTNTAHDMEVDNVPRRKSGLYLLQAGPPNFGRKRPKEPSPENVRLEAVFPTIQQSLKRRRDDSEESPFTRVKKSPRTSGGFPRSQSDATVVYEVHEQNDDQMENVDISPPKHSLPLVQNPHHDTIQVKVQIDAQTLAALLESNGREIYNMCVSQLSLIDCRYPYEFNGGHIKGALNLHEQNEMRSRLFSPQALKANDRNRVFVFYCEYSQVRAPRMWHFVRNLDRKMHLGLYPWLAYPYIILLHGGYKNFFENFPHLCDPSAHIRMRDKNHSSELRQISKSKSFAGSPSTVTRRPGLQRGLFRS